MVFRFHAGLETLDFCFLMWSWRNTLLHFFSLFKNPVSRSYQSGLRQLFDALTPNSVYYVKGWRIVTVAGKEVQCPQEAVEFCPIVRGRIWVRTLNPRSRYVRSSEDFRNTLEAWDFTVRRAPPQSSMRDTRPQEGSAAADA